MSCFLLPLFSAMAISAAQLKALVDARRAGCPLPPARVLIEPELIVRNSTLPFASWKQPRFAG